MIKFFFQLVSKIYTHSVLHPQNYHSVVTWKLTFCPSLYLRQEVVIHNLRTNISSELKHLITLKTVLFLTVQLTGVETGIQEKRWSFDEFG